MSFRPRGAMTDDELASENIAGFRRRSLPEIAARRSPELFRRATWPHRRRR